MANSRDRNRAHRQNPNRKIRAKKVISPSDSSAPARARQVLEDMRLDSSLSLSEAARKRRIDPRSVRKHLGSELRKDSSGRVRAKPRNLRHKTLWIPTITPGVSIPVVTKNKPERLMLGRWMAALNAAGRGHWSKMKKFPRRVVIDGVRLATSPKEVQPILNALAEAESPFEGLYRTLVRRS